jgi:hypothetical protein
MARPRAKRTTQAEIFSLANYPPLNPKRLDSQALLALIKITIQEHQNTSERLERTMTEYGYDDDQKAQCRRLIAEGL